MSNNNTQTLQVVLAVSEMIRELGEIPSGHLFVALQSQLNISLDSYQSIVKTLKHAGLVSEKHHLLTWIGPLKGEKTTTKNMV